MIDAPEKIWIEQDCCPYFYEESELADVGSPVTEYIRADLCHRPALEPSAARSLALEEAARKLINELSGNPGELIDRMAEAIRDWGSHYDDGPWETLPEDRKAGWRGDAIRALAAVKEYLTTRALSSPDHADAGKVEGDGLPQDIINLVIAAREVWEELLYYHTDEDFSQRVKALDKALEPFGERVPFENEPDALPSAPSEGAE